MIFLIVIVAVVIGTALMALYLRTFQPELFDPLYYGKIYSGNRNIGTITVNVDGQAYTLTEDNFSTDDYEKFGFRNPNFDVLTIREDGSAKVEIGGGEKEHYGYAVTVDCMEYPMVFKFGHNPWWTVVNYDLTINVNTTQNTVTCEGHCTENGDKETVSQTATTVTVGNDTYAVLHILSMA